MITYKSTIWQWRSWNNLNLLRKENDIMKTNLKKMLGMTTLGMS